jgi:predicted transcriptional regulator
MDIQTEKLNLIKWLINVNEPSVIGQFIALKQKQETDWWDDINLEEKNEIEEGLSQADAGQLIAHEEAMAKYDKWRTK